MHKRRFSRLLILSVVAVGFMVSAPNASAHSGGTDKNGCHVCRTNCARYGMTTGFYHQHNPTAPCKRRKP